MENKKMEKEIRDEFKKIGFDIYILSETIFLNKDYIGNFSLILGIFKKYNISICSIGTDPKGNLWIDLNVFE